MATPLHDRPHAAHPRDVLAGLRATAHGLAGAEAARRRDLFGPNALPEARRTSPLLRFLAQFDNVIIYVLLVSAAIKLVYRDPVDATVIAAVAVIIAVIGFVQEGQAEKALAGIRRMLSPQATARRDGSWQSVDASTLVPGDIVRVHPGDRAPADARLVEARGVRADEAPLTGESEPVDKHVDAVASDAAVADRSSMLHAGSVVVSGRAVAVVTATGERTELGRIQRLVREADSPDTPLTREIDGLGRRIVVAIAAATAAMIAIGFLLHADSLEELLSAAIGFAVAAVPEGLPAVVTITLALGVRHMATRSAIVRRLPAVETLGSVTVICSDKTGTLTRNEMTVREVVTAAGPRPLTPDGCSDTGGGVGELATALAVCNDARVAEVDGLTRVVGDPTEAALVLLARACGVDTGRHRRLDEIPFDAETRLMATSDSVDGAAPVLTVKGAPDRVLALCADQRAATGATEPLDEDFWDREVARLGGQGMRVLAAAVSTRPVPAGPLTTSSLADLTLLGVVAIADPPRPEAVAAIAECRRAGIRVIMITGDHALTARAIAAELGITTPGARTLTGAEVELLDDDALAAAVADVDVYARTDPGHKLRIVAALQERGEVVAMTGDGVNDAPALMQADVGVAMGVKGTEAAKDAADLVLADDDFATIEGAVRQGRRIYDNLRTSMLFILATTFAQALIVFASVTLGFTPPLEPTQILWVNLVTGVTLSLAFAYEHVDPGVMNRPPRPRGEGILARQGLRIVGIGTAVAAVSVAAFFTELARGAELNAARTTAVAVLVLSQVAVLFSVRFAEASSLTARVLRGNRAIWVSIAVLAALQTLYTYVPAFHAWFGSRTLGAIEWSIAVAFAAACFAAVEIGKAAGRILSRRRQARVLG
ncbi:cation-translocating P-type ATPase [Microbacterium aureliae]